MRLRARSSPPASASRTLPSLTLPVLGRGPFVTRKLDEPRLVRRIGVVQANGRTFSPVARAFLGILNATDIVALLADDRAIDPTACGSAS